MSWGYYLSFTGAALVSLLLGASAVHNYYKPSVVSPEYLNVAVILCMKCCDGIFSFQVVPKVPLTLTDKPSSLIAIRTSPTREK